MNVLSRLFKEEEGQALTEYGLIIGLVAIVVIGVMVAMGGELKSLFTNIKEALASTKDTKLTN